jgi:hypothetical protein
VKTRALVLAGAAVLLFTAQAGASPQQRPATPDNPAGASASQRPPVPRAGASPSQRPSAPGNAAGASTRQRPPVPGHAAGARPAAVGPSEIRVSPRPRPPLRVQPYVVDLGRLEQACRSRAARCDHPVVCSFWGVGCSDDLPAGAP